MMITTREEWPHATPRVLLSSSDPLTLDSFPQLLFTRLLLDPADMQCVGPQGEGVQEATQPEVIVYLTEVYGRCWAARDRPEGDVARKVSGVRSILVCFFLFSLELHPLLY